MHPSHGPTRRECVLVIMILGFFLYFSSLPPRHSFIALAPPPPNSNDSFNSSTTYSRHLETYALQKWITQLRWGSALVPTTKVVAHAPGWTIFDKLYILDGKVYLVTDHPESVPEVSKMYSKGYPIETGKEAEDSRLPDDDDMRIISTKEAHKLFGTGAQIIDGVSFFCNDPPQYVTHYYHWSAELWFGFWRTYSSLDPEITSDGNTTLPPPRRLIFNRLDNYHWRDYASMNQQVLRSSFPSISMEFVDDWRDRAEMHKPYVFDRVVLADRSAAMPAYNYQRYQRTAAVSTALPGSVDWWMTLRNKVVQFVDTDPAAYPGTLDKPVITYISRQSWPRRKLIPEDHESLVKELYALRDTYGYEINIVIAEEMTRKQQIQLASRTTILMGVHGNGLTSMLWMKPTPRSTVIEFFFPGGFAHDYEFTTRAMGMTHYGFWGNTSFTSPGFPLPAYPEGFQGNSIPLDGAAVARLCHDRLTLQEELDD